MTIFSYLYRGYVLGSVTRLIFSSFLDWLESFH